MTTLWYDVEKTLAEGAIIIGKTAQDEFGFGTFSANTGIGFEAPKNPVDSERSCGGSSGGSAGFTAFSNLSSDGWFSAITVSKVEMIGELILLSETMTMQFAVPPRISGPYDGIQLISFPSTMPAYASVIPIERTPCPPKPATNSS